MLGALPGTTLKRGNLILELEGVPYKGFEAMISRPYLDFISIPTATGKLFWWKFSQNYVHQKRWIRKPMLVFISVWVRNSPYIFWSHWSIHHLSVDEKKADYFVINWKSFSALGSMHTIEFLESADFFFQLWIQKSIS